MSEFITHIGTDESGKGDFFGPLVVAGVMADEKSAEIFVKLGIKDSKKLSDKKMLILADEIKKIAPHSVIVISNPKYNQLYANIKNLNRLLAWGHARAIENILENNHCEYALSDKFGDENLIKSALMKNGRTIRLEQMCKAESDIAVAAASVLARAVFVQRMQVLQNQYGIAFPKGCSSLVKDAAKEFVLKHGREKLADVCKTHFKTYMEILNNV